MILEPNYTKHVIYKCAGERRECCTIFEADVLNTCFNPLVPCLSRDSKSEEKSYIVRRNLLLSAG